MPEVLGGTNVAVGTLDGYKSYIDGEAVKVAWIGFLSVVSEFQRYI
jgi:hypothetical protein